MGKGSGRRPGDVGHRWPMDCPHPHRVIADRIEASPYVILRFRCKVCGATWDREFEPDELDETFLDTGPME